VLPELEPHAARLRGTTLRELFDQDPDRAERLSLQAGELLLDYSKNLLDDAAVTALLSVARGATRSTGSSDLAGLAK